MSDTFDLNVNGKRVKVTTNGTRSLLSVLRDDLGLTGAKYGCGEARCGACTVLVDGRSVRSCMLQLARVVGKQITTIESLEEGGVLHPVQQAFLDEGALQCGFCTPGMILATVALLASSPDPSEEQIVRHLDGNLCRCGAYTQIIAAVRKAAGNMKGAVS